MYMAYVLDLTYTHISTHMFASMQYVWYVTVTFNMLYANNTHEARITRSPLTSGQAFSCWRRRSECGTRRWLLASCAYWCILEPAIPLSSPHIVVYVITETVYNGGEVFPPL